MRKTGNEARERGRKDDLSDAIVAAEGSWSESDVEEWERAREGAWATWPAELCSTPTS